MPCPSTSANLEQMREPPPTTQFCSIDETLHSHPQNSNIESQPLARHSYNSVAQPVAQNSLSNLYSSGEHLGQNARNRNSMNCSVANPYMQRADEIGPSHHIPGIGHLGNLLIPFGWREGDEPINPERINQLFILARQQAKDKLVLRVDQTKHLTEREKEILNAEQDRLWDVRYKLDQVLFNERLNVYEQYQKREHAEHGRHYEEQKNKVNFQPFHPPHPVNPPTNTSFSSSPKPVFPYSPTAFGGRAANNIDLNSSQGQTGKLLMVLSSGDRAYKFLNQAVEISQPLLQNS